MAAYYQAKISLAELNTEALSEAVERWGLENRLSTEARYTLQLAIEELVTNIVKYGVRTGPKPFVEIEIREENGEVVLTVSDNTAAFDPLAIADPDVTQPAEERKIGGLGLFLIRKKVASIDYEFRNGLNVVRAIIRQTEKTAGNS